MTQLSSLKKRIITASILAPIVLAMTFSGSSTIFAMLLLLFLSLSAFEWARLSGLQHWYTRAAYITCIVFLFIYFVKVGQEYLLWLLGFVSVWWLVVVMYLFFATPKQNQRWKLFKLIQGVVILVAAMVATFAIHAYYGPALIAYLFAIIWGADIGAYFSGKRFGKRKLAPNISPGKTIEGVLGGLIAVLILACIVSTILFDHISDSVVFVCASVIIASFSIAGDLYESILKREAGVKDSSNLLPGHGGVLDRIDSLLSAAPLFMLLCVYML